MNVVFHGYLRTHIYLPRFPTVSWRITIHLKLPLSPPPSLSFVTPSTKLAVVAGNSCCLATELDEFEVSSRQKEQQQKKTLKLIKTLVKQYITRIGNVLEMERKRTMKLLNRGNKIGKARNCYGNETRLAVEPKTLTKTLLKTLYIFNNDGRYGNVCSWYSSQLLRFPSSSSWEAEHAKKICVDYNNSEFYNQ